MACCHLVRLSHSPSVVLEYTSTLMGLNVKNVVLVKTDTQKPFSWNGESKNDGFLSESHRLTQLLVSH